jgi:hypothetical protein
MVVKGKIVLWRHIIAMSSGCRWSDIKHIGEISSYYCDDYEYGIDRSFGCPDALMMEAVSASEMSVSIYLTARLNIPEDSHLQRAYACILSTESLLERLSHYKVKFIR